MCSCKFGGGLQTSHCARCHETFTGLRAFDLHQTLTGEGVICRDPATLTRRNGAQMLRRDARTGFWQEFRPDLAPHPRAAR